MFQESGAIHVGVLGGSGGPGSWQHVWRKHTGLLAIGDVIRGSSWPVRGLDGELRDSLVMEAGHNWIMAPADGARIDHDILVQNRAQIVYSPESGAWVLYGHSASFWNDTFDVSGPTLGRYGDLLSVDSGSSLTSFRNNLVTGFPSASSRGLAPGANGAGSARNVGYNDFWQPFQTSQRNYAITIVSGAHGRRSRPLPDAVRAATR